MSGLPATWTTATLSEVAAINPGWLHTPDGETVISFVPMAAAEAGTGRLDPAAARTVQEVKTGFTRFQDGDVLFAKITPSMENGKMVIARNLRAGLGAGTTEFHVLRPSNGVLPEFILYFVLQEGFRREAQRHMKGVAGQLRVPADFLAEATLPLPPLAQQRRIVAAIEEHFTRLDAAVAALRRVRANLKRYRAAVLKAACEGRLVPTEAELARAEGREYEPASMLLERVRRALTANSKDRTVPPAASDQPALAQGWRWTTLGQVFGVYVGATPSRGKPEYWGGRIPWVSSGEVAFCTVRRTRETITEAGLRDTSTRLHPPGTVLLGMIGEGKTRGQVALLGVEACNNQNSAAIRVSEVGFPPEYVYRYLEMRYEETRRIGSGNNQPALNKTRVENMWIPIPPLAEQRRIVAEVERRLSVVDEVEAAVEQQLKRAERLRQAILKRAFAGKLVPQDPTDEPASVLLERIRAERRSQPQAVQARRRRAAAQLRL